MAARGAKLDAARLERIVRGFARVRVLVVGDVMLDEHLWGEVERVSPEAPVPVVHVREESIALGGAGNVVRNIVALGGRCALCAVAGDDAAGRTLRELLKEQGVDADGVILDAARPTSHKTRVIARSQHVVRFDRETDDPVSPATARRLRAAFDAALPDASAVIFEDYGKGLLAPSFLRSLVKRCSEAGIYAAADPKTSLAPFKGVDLLKPNLREAEILAGQRIRGRDDLDRAVQRMRRRIGPADVVVTRGAEGLAIYEADRRPVDVPTVAREVFDVQGAGDTTIAALVLARRAGASLLEAAVIANAAAGVVVGKIGTATVSADELCALLPTAVTAAGRTP